MVVTHVLEQLCERLLVCSLLLIYYLYIILNYGLIQVCFVICSLPLLALFLLLIACKTIGRFKIQQQESGGSFKFQQINKLTPPHERTR